MPGTLARHQHGLTLAQIRAGCGTDPSDFTPPAACLVWLGCMPNRLILTMSLTFTLMSAAPANTFTTGSSFKRSVLDDGY